MPGQPPQTELPQTKAPTVGAYTQALPQSVQSIVASTQVSAAVWQ